jgi:hypothetical protein
VADSQDVHLHEPRPARQSWSPFAAALLVAAIGALLLWAFTWAPARLAPRDLPVGVAGPAAVVGAIRQQLAQRGAAFDGHVYRDEPAARQALADRDVYGAVVAVSAGLTVLTASAASPTVAQLLQQAIASPPAPGASGTEAAPPARVVDVVPADPQDPRGWC